MTEKIKDGPQKDQIIQILKVEIIQVTEYITNLRIKNACNQLLTTNNSIREISEELGFVRTSYFSRVFKNHTGLSPLQYRQMNQLADKA